METVFDLVSLIFAVTYFSVSNGARAGLVGRFCAIVQRNGLVYMQTHVFTFLQFSPVFPTGLTHDTPPPEREVTGERPDPDLPPQFEPTGKTV